MPERNYEEEFEDRPRRRPPRDPDEDDDRPRRRRSPRDEDDDYDDRPRRRRPAYEDEDEDDYDDRPRRRRRRRELAPPSATVTAVGMVNLALAVLLIGLVAYTLFRGGQILQFLGIILEDVAQQQQNDPRLAQKMQRMQGMMASLFIFLSGCFFVIFILPLILAGIGVLLRRQWGRVLNILIGIVTALGAVSAAERLYEGNRDAVWGLLVLGGYSLFVLTVLFIPQFADEFE
jgi:hypothetical protein